MPGGRPKGSKNKRTVELLKKAAAVPSYVDPVDFLLNVVADVGADMGIRIEAAKASAPYVRAKLTPIAPPEAQAGNPGPSSWDDDDPPLGEYPGRAN
jgi:hypothetical protein